MARRWVERDHPRHQAKSPGGVGGQFRERVGSGGWAARLNAMLGGRRGASERQVRRAGGRSDLGDVDYRDPDSPEMRDAERQIAAGLAGPARGTADYEPQPMADGGNLPRLTNQEVADALAPQRDRAAHDAYNSTILDEAMEFLPALGDEDEDFDEELDAQIRIVINARNSGNNEDWDYAVDHLRRMLTLGYMDEDELPPLLPGRRSGTTGV